MRLSINLAAQTIEQVMSKRRKLLVDMQGAMAMEVRAELRGSGFESVSVRQLDALLGATVLSHPPAAYNADDVFHAAVTRALEHKQSVLRHPERLLWMSQHLPPSEYAAHAAPITHLLTHAAGDVRAAALTAFGALPEKERCECAAELIAWLGAREAPASDESLAPLAAADSAPRSECPGDPDAVATPGAPTTVADGAIASRSANSPASALSPLARKPAVPPSAVPRPPPPPVARVETAHIRALSDDGATAEARRHAEGALETILCAVDGLRPASLTPHLGRLLRLLECAPLLLDAPTADRVIAHTLAAVKRVVEASASGAGPVVGAEADAAGAEASAAGATTAPGDARYATNALSKYSRHVLESLGRAVVRATEALLEVAGLLPPRSMRPHCRLLIGLLRHADGRVRDVALNSLRAVRESGGGVPPKDKWLLLLKLHTAVRGDHVEPTMRRVAVAALKQLGSSAGGLRRLGYTASDLMAGGYGEDLHSLGYGAVELLEAGFSVEGLRGVGFSASELKKVPVGATELLRGGFSEGELRQCGFGAAALLAAGSTAANLVAAQFTLRELRDAGCTADALKAAGCTAAACKEGGFGALELRDGGYELGELANVARFTAEDLKWAKFSVDELLGAGFSFERLKRAYPVDDLMAAGFSPADVLG